jgi:hypothetical protein
LRRFFGKIRALVQEHKVLPSDILILYKTHQTHRNKLAEKLMPVLGTHGTLRFVDAENRSAKNQPLMEECALKVSTIASAKGYDAPVVFLIGVDELDTDASGRASFYVGATRAKMCLYVSGTTANTGLVDEVLAASQSLSGNGIKGPRFVGPPVVAPPVVRRLNGEGTAGRLPSSFKACRRCRSERLHAQHGRYGYFFRCIDCTENAPIDVACSKCAKKSRIRKAGLKFYRECETCGSAELIHTNLPLDSL